MWKEAQRLCNNLGMSLITVQNVDKQNCLNDFFTGAPIIYYLKKLGLGKNIF